MQASRCYYDEAGIAPFRDKSFLFSLTRFHGWTSLEMWQQPKRRKRNTRQKKSFEDDWRDVTKHQALPRQS